jgi:hypothetical protein
MSTQHTGQCTNVAICPYVSVGNCTCSNVTMCQRTHVAINQMYTRDNVRTFACSLIPMCMRGNFQITNVGMCECCHACGSRFSERGNVEVPSGMKGESGFWCIAYKKKTVVVRTLFFSVETQKLNAIIHLKKFHFF